LADALGGRSRVTVLRGEAGVGKSALWRISREGSAPCGLLQELAQPVHRGLDLTWALVRLEPDTTDAASAGVRDDGAPLAAAGIEAAETDPAGADHPHPPGRNRAAPHRVRAPPGR
jgi:hypothetical protein